MTAVVALIWQRVSAIFFAIIGTPVGAGAVVAGALLVWNAGVDNPRVTREARADYVAKAETKALEAQLAEEQRQRAAAEYALAAYTKQAGADAAADVARAEALEQRIADYEQELALAGRSCVLTAADVEWLRNNGRPAGRSR